MQKFMVICALMLLACSDDKDSESCVKGKIIHSSCCTNTTFVELTTTAPLGKPLTYNGIAYRNVIQVRGIFHGKNLEFTGHAFDAERDARATATCYCLVAEPLGSAPLYIIDSLCSIPG